MKDYTFKTFNSNNNFNTISEFSSENSSLNVNKSLGIHIDGEDDAISYLTDSSITGLSNQGEDTDDYNFYNPLPLNKNNLYNSNLLSENNSTSQIIENYRNNVLNNYKTKLNISSSAIHSNYISPEPSRPGSSLNKLVSSNTNLQHNLSSNTESVCRKKPHIEDLIDVASNINSTLRHKDISSSLMENTASSYFHNHIVSDLVSNNSCYQKINESDIKYYEYPLSNNFATNNRNFGIQYYIDQYFNIVNNSFIRNDDLIFYKTVISSDEITDLINNKNTDECIDTLVNLVQNNTKLENKTRKLSKIYKLTEPAISFQEYLKKRVCTKLDKETIISAIVQLMTVFRDVKINEDEQHKFVMSVLKINYKINNDILLISNSTFSKMVGMKVEALKACELELIKMISKV